MKCNPQPDAVDREMRRGSLLLACVVLAVVMFAVSTEAIVRCVYKVPAAAGRKFPTQKQGWCATAGPFIHLITYLICNDGGRLCSFILLVFV
jgi:hypothetical protein